MGLTVEGLSYTHGNGFSLTGIDFHADNGRVLGVIGPNGSGKSTLLQCLAGVLTPQGGTIRIDGRETDSMSRREVARHVGYVAQNHTVTFPFRVLDVVLMGRCPHLGVFESPSRHDEKLASDRLRELGVGHLSDRPYSHISGGERRLVMIARALAQQADIVILDEPTAYLDFRNRHHVIENISELSRASAAVIVSVHDPADALTFCNDALLLCDGKVVARGRSHEMITEDNLSRAYEVPIRRVNTSRFVVQTESLAGAPSGSRQDRKRDAN